MEVQKQCVTTGIGGSAATLGKWSDSMDIPQLIFQSIRVGLEAYKRDSYVAGPYQSTSIRPMNISLVTKIFQEQMWGDLGKFVGAIFYTASRGLLRGATDAYSYIAERVSLVELTRCSYMHAKLPARYTTFPSLDIGAAAEKGRWSRTDLRSIVSPMTLYVNRLKRPLGDFEDY